jgi:Zn-dependent protease
MVRRNDDPGHRALVALNADLGRLATALPADRASAAPTQKTAPIGTATRYLLNNAHREAEQVGHHQLDSLHLLLALLYNDSRATADLLQQAGLSIYAVRAYLTGPAPTTRSMLRRPLPSLRGAIGVSPVFAIPVGATVVGGLGLFVGAPSALILPLTILFVVGGWVTSLCIHEFGHALVAYLGGDRSVAAAGYLTLNPLKYTHPLLSIGLPLVFLFIGGFGLPGGAVYLNENAIRDNRWRSMASAAGPLGNLLFALLVGWPFLLHVPDSGIGDLHFWAALSFLIFLQVSAIVLNLLPIPPFDGFGMIAPWLSIEIRILAQRLGMLPMLLLSFFLWQGGPISLTFWTAVYNLAGILQVPDFLISAGQQQFHL